MVQSTGGLFDLTEAQQLLHPHAGVGPGRRRHRPRRRCATNIGLDNAIAFDMGGTTAKAGVIHHGQVLDDRQLTWSAATATGLPVQIPMIDIQEVGTGGGSIARVDAAGALRVGPDSAGADPGPVCYGRGGTEPTVTDANLVLGRLAPDRFLGGDMRLDLPAASSALIEKVAKPLGLDATAAADGILRIATITMSHVVRGVTTERGLDAADFALIAYGGAGPLHACDGRARTAHRRGHRSRARRGIFRPSACCSRICGAISSSPGSALWPTSNVRGHGSDLRRAWRRRAAPRIAQSNVLDR